MMKGKHLTLIGMLFWMALYPACEAQHRDDALKEVLKEKFYIGTTMNEAQITGKDVAARAIIHKHFNSIVAENCMKGGALQPREGQFNFDLADRFVDFGRQNQMHIHGHTLIWHSRSPRWFFTDSLGNDVSREVLIRRMKDHIHTVVTRYKGKVHSWDVVNEAILDDGSWRESKFYKIIGEDFVALAFQFAHEADPQAKLYYNDYSMASPGKRAGVVAMVEKLKQQGVQVHGIGMQGHIGLDHPAIDEFEKSILAFSALGVNVMITELDLTVLPSPWDTPIGADVSANVEYQPNMNPYPNGLPDAVARAFHDRYLSFFKLFLKYHDTIDRVALWGVADHHSWKNNWPIRGRTDYPLLFDRDNQPKAAVRSILELVQQ